MSIILEAFRRLDGHLGKDHVVCLPQDVPTKFKHNYVVRLHCGYMCLKLRTIVY